MKITKRQLTRIIAEEKQKINEAPAYRVNNYKRKKSQSLQQLMNSIRSQITFIEGQLLMGSFDYEDMFDWDFGHIAGLADTIDAAREKATEEGVPFVEPDTSRIADYQHRGKPAVVSRWSMNESTNKDDKMKITNRQLRRIIREAKASLKESRDDERFKSYRGVMSEPSDSFPNARIGHDKLNNPSASSRIETALESIASVEEYIPDARTANIPGFHKGGQVDVALENARFELEELLRGN